MSDNGWVKLYRKSIEASVFQNPNLWMFWSYCLIKATHKPRKAMVGYQEIDLKPGQFIFGRKKAAEDLPLTERNIRTCLKKLENLGILTTKVTNKFTIITIRNWDTYQKKENESDQQSDQQVTSKRPASDQQVTTDKNVKNVKNVKNKESGKKKPGVQDRYLSFARNFYSFLSKEANGKKKYTEKEIKDGAATVEKLVRIDGYDLEEEIRPALRWGVMDDFWSAQIRSLAQLRKKRTPDSDRKFDNLFAQYSARRSTPDGEQAPAGSMTKEKLDLLEEERQRNLAKKRNQTNE